MPLADKLANCAWVMSQTGDPDPYVVTWGSYAGTSGDFDDLLNAMVSTYETNIAPLMNDELTLVEARGVWNDGGTLNARSVTSGTAGGRSSMGTPSNCALLVQKRTGLAGRANRGRSFWPGILDRADVDQNGIVSGTAMTSYNTAFGSLLTDLTFTGVSPVLLQAGGSAGVALTDYIPQSTIATQRRRMRP